MEFCNCTYVITYEPKDLWGEGSLEDIGDEKSD